MNIETAFPSTFLKAADLQGRTVKVIIKNVSIETVGRGEDQKPILYFEGKEKGLAMNRTNANNIIAAYGTETDNWRGKELYLYTALVDFQGKTVEAIRVRTSPPPSQASAPAPVKTAPQPAYDDGFGDSEIPF